MSSVDLSEVSSRPSERGGQQWPGLRQFAVEDPSDISSKVSDNYVLKEVIGRGASSIVYRTRRRADHKQLAIKVFCADTKSQRDAQEEYDVLRSLRHPNIIRAHDFFVDKDKSFLVLEYFPGLPLSHAVKRAPGGQLLELNARELCVALLLAISHMHQQDAVHGNIKPRHVLISDDMRDLRLIDFTTASIGGGSKRSRAQKVPSSAECYAAPEVLLGEPPSTCSDMWQLGLCLFVMLAGKLPQERNYSRDFPEPKVTMARRHISVRDPRLAHLSESCKQVLRRCLVVDKQERPKIAEVLCGEWLSAGVRNTMSRQGQESPDALHQKCPLLPGLEPAARSSSARPSTARRRLRTSSLLEKAGPASQTSTQPSSSSSLRMEEASECTDAASLRDEASASPTVEVLRPRREMAKVLLANRLDGTYKVRLEDGSIVVLKGEEVQPCPAVEILRPKREMAKVLLANRVDGTYKVRLSDGSTKIVKSEDVEGGTHSGVEDLPSIVEIPQRKKEVGQVLLANRMDGTFKVRMRDGSVRIVSADAVSPGTSAASG